MQGRGGARCCSNTAKARTKARCCTSKVPGECSDDGAKGGENVWARTAAVSRVRTMPKGAKYETPTASGVNSAGKNFGLRVRPWSSRSQNGSHGAGRADTKSDQERLAPAQPPRPSPALVFVCVCVCARAWGGGWGGGGIGRGENRTKYVCACVCVMRM